MTHDEQAREIIRAFNVDHAGNRVANVTDLLEQIVGKAIEEAVAAERERAWKIAEDRRVFWAAKGTDDDPDFDASKRAGEAGEIARLIGARKP